MYRVKIAILGYGIQGRSAFNYWKSDDNEITICDQNENIDIPEGASTKLGTDYLIGLDQYDLIVRSPNVHPNAIVSANSPDILGRVTTPTNEFMKVSPTKNIIGVTGTKGKGTTSSLIVKILETGSKTVYLGGNFGTSPLDLLNDGLKPENWVVLELANFQLIDLKKSPHITVCLMISPEHLDWHGDMDEYVNSKKQLFIHQKQNDIAIYYAKNEQSTKVAAVGPANKIPYYEKPGAVVEDRNFVIDNQIICSINDLQLLGEHNWQNVCAAITTTWQILKKPSVIKDALVNFKGLEHRLELVRELNGIKFYNDSFGSAPDATVAAIKAIKDPKVIIIGGFDRMLPLGELVETIKNHTDSIRKVILIGASGERVSRELESAGFSNLDQLSSKNIGEIVGLARDQAKAGDVVILSPGFPSFDMFKNFEERGNKFKEAVNNL